MNDKSSTFLLSPSRRGNRCDAKEGLSPSSTTSSNITSSSPLHEKRRSHLHRVAVESVRSSTAKKRVSFHQHQLLPRSLWPEGEASLVSHQYQSNWVLADDVASRILPPQIRRYQSDCFLNQLGDGPLKHLPLAERGVPEGQEKDEDPEQLYSLQNLSVIECGIGGAVGPFQHEETLLLPRRLTRLSPTSRSALNILSSIKALGGGEPKPKTPCRTAEENQALAQWAQDKWARRFSVALPKPANNGSVMTQDLHNDITVTPNLESNSSTIMADGEQYKVKRLFGNFLNVAHLFQVKIFFTGL